MKNENGYTCFKCGEWITYGIVHMCPEPPPDLRPKVYCIECIHYYTRKYIDDYSYCDIYDVSMREDCVEKITTSVPIGRGSFLGNKGDTFCHCKDYRRANWWIRSWREISPL